MNRLKLFPALAALAFGMIPAPTVPAAASASPLAARLKRRPADALLARSRYLRDRRLGAAADFSAVPAAAERSALPAPAWMNPRPDAVLGATWTTVGSAGYTVASRSAQGRATALWVNPADGNEIWAGFAGGGLWNTTNGGGTWTPLGDRFLSLSIGAIAVDTTTVPRRVFVGTGEGNFTQDGTLGVGVYFSTDGGATFTLSALPWTAPMLAQERAIRKIAIDPKNTNHLYAVGDGGLFNGVYSPGTGTIAWNLGTGLPYTGKVPCGAASYNYGVYFTDIVIDPNYSPTIAAVYAAIGTPFDEPNCGTAPQVPRTVNGVYRSLDGGASFTAILTPGIGGFTPVGQGVGPGRVSLALARAENPTPPTNPALPQRLFVLAHDLATDGIDAVYYAQTPTTATTLTGWVKREPGNIFGSRGWFNMALLGDPAFTPASAAAASRLFVGGLQVNLSNDGGLTLTPVSSSSGANYVHDGIHDLAATANGLTLVAASDGGIYRGVVSGNSVAWTILNGGGLNTLQYFGLGVSPVSTTIMNGGTIDNDETHTAAAGVWTAAGCGGAAAGAGGCGDSGVSLFTSGGATAYQEGAFASVRRSSDSGATFPTCLRDFGGCAGVPACDPSCMPDNQTAFVAPMALDSANTLYTASKKLYKYNGTTFVPLPASGDFVSSGAGQWYATVSAIAAAPSNPLIIYAGTTDGQVWRTLNGGATFADWTNLSASPLPASLSVSDTVSRPVTAISVHPTLPAQIIVSYGGYSASTSAKPGHFFRSMNATTTAAFTNITPAGLVDLPVESALLAPGGADLMFGMDRGVGQLAAVFTTPVYNNVTGNAPNAAYFALAYTAAGKLRAASHGRGVFELATLTTGPVPVPDGTLAGTTPFRLKKNAGNSANLDATWDSAGCGSPGYNIYYGPLTPAALGSGYGFTGSAACNNTTGSQSNITPAAGSLFFTVSGFDDPTKKDSPASQDSGGTYRGSGVTGALCAVTTTASGATCP